MKKSEHSAGVKKLLVVGLILIYMCMACACTNGNNDNNCGFGGYANAGRENTASARNNSAGCAFVCAGRFFVYNIQK